MADVPVITGTPIAPIEASPPSLTTAAMSDVGRRRKNNEDFFVLDDVLGLYVVCDGVGGHQDGEVASREAAEFVAQYVGLRAEQLRKFDGTLEARTQLSEMVASAIREASDRVATVAKNGDMGTTMTLLLFVKNTAIMGHVGDSRLYMCRQGKLHQLSEDHNVFNEILAKSNPDMKMHPSANVLTRVLGQKQWLQVDTFTFDPLPNDTFLLCSDGLSEYMQDASELAKLMSQGSVASLPSKLVGLANERGGKDNVTALCVRVEAEGMAADDLDRTVEMATHFDAFLRCPLFDGISHIDRMRLRYSCDDVPFSAGDIITHEGEGAAGAVVVLEGEVTMKKHGQVLGKVRPGSFFGESSLIEPRTRDATTVAETDGLALLLSRDQLDAMVAEEPALGTAIFRNLAKALQAKLDRTEGLF